SAPPGADPLPPLPTRERQEHCYRREQCSCTNLLRLGQGWSAGIPRGWWGLRGSGCAWGPSGRGLVGVLVLRRSAEWIAGCGLEPGLELADDSSDAVAGDGVADGAQGVLDPVAADAAGLLVDAASVLEDDLIG